MSDLDEFRKRLDALRNVNKSTVEPTDGELKERLAKLRGIDLSDGVNKKENNYLIPSKARTDVEQSDDLFKELYDEIEIENKIRNREQEQDDVLFSKLSNLKINNDVSNNQSTSNELDQFGFNDNFVSKSFDRTNKQNNKIISQEELSRELSYLKDKMKEFNYEYKDMSSKDASNQAKAKSNKKKASNNQIKDLDSSTSEEEEEKYVGVVKKLMEEVELEKKLTGQKDEQHTDRLKDDDGIEFCYICNEDATLDCKDCDDRFCLGCFKEFHQDPDYRAHRYSKIQQSN